MNFLKKNWYLIVPAGLLLLPVLMVLYTSMAYGYTFGESIDVLRHATESDTKYQQLKFSEDAFRKIRPPMTGKDVFELLGVPLERHDNDTRWLYAVPVNNSKYFHERTVLLEKGKVTGTICRFHTPESK